MVEGPISTASHSTIVVMSLSTPGLSSYLPTFSIPNLGSLFLLGSLSMSEPLREAGKKSYSLVNWYQTLLMRYKLISSLRVTKTDASLSRIPNQFPLHSPSRAHLNIHQISQALGHHWLLVSQRKSGHREGPSSTPHSSTSYTFSHCGSLSWSRGEAFFLQD